VYITLYELNYIISKIQDFNCWLMEDNMRNTLSFGSKYRI
jgi:hypothetical protein